MEKHEVIKGICDGGVVAVIRAESADQAQAIGDACLAGGLNSLEITLTVPGAIDVIKDLRQSRGGSGLLLGAGTVLDSETARIAILAGADFIVSPYFDPETVRLCNRYGVPCMPGAMTVKEVVAAMEAGADIVKIFPGELFGPRIIKAIKGPLPHAKLMPTGGVDLDNVGEWIKAGSSAVGVGGSLTSGVKSGDYRSVTDMARKLVERVREARRG